MPETIVNALQSNQLLTQWYSWGVFVSLGVALLVLIAVFADSYRIGDDATIWKSLAAVAAVLGVPALLPRLYAGLAWEMRDSLEIVAYTSIFAVVLAIIAAAGYFATRRSEYSAVYLPPAVGGANGWGQVPAPAAPLPMTQTGIFPGADGAGVNAPPAPAPAFAGTLGGQVASPLGPAPAATRVGGAPLPGGRPAVSKGTVIINLNQSPPALGFLSIVTGPYAETILRLRTDTPTKVGRDGLLNDFALDDEAVSGQHVSIKYEDGQFIATDLDSANGTRINGEVVTRRALQPHDIVEVGRTKLVFLQVPSEILAR